MMKENTNPYIEKRKRIAIRLSVLFYLNRIFPVNNNRIVFSAFEGDGGFCCNPRYIAEELHRRMPEKELIWLSHSHQESFPPYIKVVKDSLINTAHYLSTAKVWIDNYRKPYGTIKRKGQYYLQTWHASMGFKAVGLFRGDQFPEIARLVSQADSALIDIMISNSEYCNRIYPRKLLYDGPTLLCGSPRVDPLINDREELRRNIRDKLRLQQNTKLLLFAPTFRGGNQQGKKQVTSEMPSVDFALLTSCLEEKFGGNWYILLRLHPQLSVKLEEMPLSCRLENMLDVSQEPDISQVMGGCDAVLTDYSSCAFDAAFSGFPVFLYADDVQEYIEQRGKFMWEIGELPFSFAEDMDTLIRNIKCFEADKYRECIKKFMATHGVLEDGRASARVADMIIKRME